MQREYPSVLLALYFQTDTDKHPRHSVWITNFKCKQTSCCQLFTCMAMSPRNPKYGVTVVLGFAQVRKKTVTCFKEFPGCSYTLLKLQKLPGSQETETITDNPTVVTSI